MVVEPDALAALGGGRGTAGLIQDYDLGVLAASRLVVPYGAELHGWAVAEAAGATAAEARTDVGQSNTGAAAAITATLAAAVGARTWITSFTVDGLGATAGSVIEVTVTGLLSGTKRYKLTIPAGVAVAITPLRITFPNPLPASADNTAIVVNVPSFGAGNTNASVSADGYQIVAAAAATPARIRIRDGRDATGPVLAAIALAANGSEAVMLGDAGITADTGVYVEVVNGSAEVTLYLRTLPYRVEE